MAKKKLLGVDEAIEAVEEKQEIAEGTIVVSSVFIDGELCHKISYSDGSSRTIGI